LKEEASVCIILYDLAFGNETASGCAKIEVKLARIKLAVFKFGCFQLGPTQHYFVSRDPEHMVEMQMLEKEAKERKKKSRIVDNKLFNVIKNFYNVINKKKPDFLEKKRF
jgi:hypothetical protein